MLSYWTVSNLPLFILATPMLYILLHSGAWAWYCGMPSNKHAAGRTMCERGAEVSPVNSVKSQLGLAQVTAFRYAVPQIVLAVLALTIYHVQVITRISSGYPVWYWWLASLIMEDHRTTFLGLTFDPARLITRWMVIYGIVQGGLFASFLPPA